MASAINNTGVRADCDSHGGGGEEVVTIVHGNYGLTCELHVEISHIYTIEGDFNISVTAFTARSEEITSVKSWTMLNVRTAIDDVSLLVESVVAVRHNVTVSASVSPRSQFVKYYWTVSSFDFMHSGVNSSLILSAVTDIPELWLVLTGVGDYLIEVTVTNEISEANDSVIMAAVVPVSGLSLSCDSDKSFATNATFECLATVEEGTDVRFAWNVGGGVLAHITTSTSNSTSTATVTNPAIGWYNTTVTASNHLSATSAWTMVNIAENVFRLSALATEPVLVGQPVSITACCALGSNLMLEFDFGSGNHQLVLDQKSRAVTAVHVYRLPGIYVVTVSAQNNVSMAVTRVTVRVLENVADVGLKTISALVAGRHSVFMAAFNGNLLHLIYVCLKISYFLSVNGLMLLVE